MRKLFVVLVILAVTAMAATSATAGYIAWAPGAGITGAEADVSTAGTLHDAVLFSSNNFGYATGQGWGTIVNGVYFGKANYTGPVAGGWGQGSQAGKIQTSMTSEANIPDTQATATVNYNFLLQTTIQTGGARDITISGLTAGNGYEIQVWGASANAGGNNTWLYFNVGQPDQKTLSTNWGYVKGTFTADAATTTKTLTWGGGPGWSGMNAMQVRLISQVPEPSTIALLATGLLGLLAYAWRKRR